MLIQFYINHKINYSNLKTDLLRIIKVYYISMLKNIDKILYCICHFKFIIHKCYIL